MAIYHLSMGQVSRSTGRSAVQAVAYITRSCLHEERRGITADYRSKNDEVFWETLAPEGSEIDKKNLSIWNKLENFEDEYAFRRYKNREAREKFINSAQVAHTYVFALPKELSQEQNIDLIRDIVAERFVSLGLVVTYSIHWEEGNPHVHINASHRAIEGNLDEGGTFSFLKVARPLCSRASLRETRKFFADKTNALFESLGMDTRIDHRSYAERGIDLIPTQHKGWMAHQLERDGLRSRIVLENEVVSEENKERIAREPSIILKELTSKQATFSEFDVLRLVQKRMKDDAANIAHHVIDSVLNEAIEVGIGMDHAKRYTAQAYFEKEERILESFETYQTQKASLAIDVEKVDVLLKNLEESESEGSIKLNEGQKNAIKVLCGDAQLSVMIGRAGTGKTTALQSVVRIHQDVGYKVIGMAPSATAASQLEQDAGCVSDTIAHYAYFWKQYFEVAEQLKDTTSDKEKKILQKTLNKLEKHLPDTKTLILVDEAGMVGVGGWQESVPGGWDALVKVLDLTGSKLILVGDDHQLKPVEAGDVFRKIIEWIKEKGSYVELKDIMRQQNPWMREASNHLAELNTGTAIEMYEREGHVQEHATNIDVYEDMAHQYIRNIIRDPDSEGIVLAATNVECQNINREIRGLLKANNMLPTEDLLQLGEDGYTVGDRIVFTKNDRGFNTSSNSKDRRFFVRNGMQAVIESIEPCRVVDGITGGVTDTYRIVAGVVGKATIQFSLKDFKHFSHGYAVTEYKGQGQTVDWSLIKMSKFMDAHALYVNMTRHRSDISLYYSKEDFVDFANLVKSAGRVSYKDLVVDYSVSEENKEFWLNVQDYRGLGQELLSIATLARKSKETEQQGIWEDYRKVQTERQQFAKLILDDREFHRDFVRQAGLTFESLEIAAGLKKRAYSRVEVQAQLIVEQYVAASIEARGLWRDIRKTHPGAFAKTHPEWGHFEAIRSQRGILANQITLNPVLYRPMLKEASQDYGGQIEIGYSSNQKIAYGMNVIRAQSEAYQAHLLQQEILRDTSNPAKTENLKILQAYVEARDEAASLWKDLSPKLKAFEGTLLKESFSKSLDEFTELRALRDSLALKILEGKEYFTPLAEEVGIKLNTDRMQTQANQAKRNKLLRGSNTVSLKPEQKTQTPSNKTISFEKHPSFEEVDKQLKDRIWELATHVLGKPTSRTSTLLRFGRKGSIVVFTQGPKQGVYSNFESGIKGGLFKLIEEQIGLSSPLEALQWASDWLGNTPPMIIERKTLERPKNAKETTWTPIIPIPKHVENPDIAGNKYLDWMLKDGFQEISRHAYRDEQGNLKGYVIRLEKENRSGEKNDKKTLPLAYCENEKGFKCWKSLAFENANKTPYGIEKLAKAPNKPILIVEGEKTADAASKLFPEYNVLTSIGGAGNVDKTNWKPLLGKEVIIWPDNDEGGHKAAEKIVTQLNSHNNFEGKVGIVDLPQNTPYKWDLADSLPESWAQNTVQTCLDKVTLSKNQPVTNLDQTPIDHKEIDKQKVMESETKSLFEDKFCADKIEKRIEELRLHKNIHYPQRGIEKVAENIYTALVELHTSQYIQKNPDKMVDQSIYMALRIQQGYILDELDQHDFLHQISLESKLFLQNPNLEFSAIYKKAQEKVRFLYKTPNKISEQAKIQEESSLKKQLDAHEFYKQFMGEKDNHRSYTRKIIHQFEKSMKNQFNQYKTHQEDLHKLMIQNKQKQRSFEHEL